MQQQTEPVVLVQMPAKAADKSKAKTGKKAGKAQDQAAGPAGASALAQSLFSRKPRKGGEKVLQPWALYAHNWHTC